jgi:hypothetical protein
METNSQAEQNQENTQTEVIKSKIELIMRQTNYSEKEASEKLEQFHSNEILVIRDYLGIPEKKETIKSLNQEIYKQIRYNLDEVMCDFNKRTKIPDPPKL